MGTGDQVIFFYAFRFEDKTDFALAYSLVQEFAEAKRHVQNAPEFLSIHKTKPPEVLLKAFPASRAVVENSLYQMVQIGLFKRHFEKNVDRAAEILQGLREYIHYHVHASKAYLNGRVRRKVQESLKDIDNSKFESEKKKVYKTLKGKGKEIKFEAEKEKLKDIINK